MRREDVGDRFRLGGWGSPSKEKKFKLEQKPEKEATMSGGGGGLDRGTNITVRWPEVRKSRAHENGEGQCGAAGVR